MSVGQNTSEAAPVVGYNEVQAWNLDGEPTAKSDAVVRIVDGLLAAWREPDQDERTRRLEGCVAGTVVFTNPATRVEGPAGISAHIAQVRDRLPGYLPVRTSGIDIHHDHARFEWSLRDSAGNVGLRGFDILKFDSAPAILAVTSFFGPIPRITYTYGSTNGSNEGPSG
ncbi:nuclear transport factor 2 family protein [Frankia sp. R43]|uniref:nuclear transport factor 2 family protein n=1 Tax=Frankia sp. R43 TaxID=269536 RepID=UPI0006CA1CD7|nr:nuclear transport factor 2 family protein [Frankia sp. R43]